MDLPTLQNTSINPNFPTHNVPQQQNHEKAMDKLREAILKLSNSPPNGPLSTSRNSILQQRLTHFLSCLHTTPDHPPYTWMIEKALQELDEEGGSSEDSISKFIKKEYDSLPWAHMTLLKHHLQKMSENGEILMVDGGRFLLPGDSESLKPKRKRKRKYLKRKRRRNLEIKQKKPRQKEKEEEKWVQHGDVEVVREQKKLDERQNEVTVNGNHGQENRICEEYWEFNGHHNELSTDKEEGHLSGQQNYVTGNKVLCKSVQRIRVHKQNGKQQLDATEGSLQSSIAIGNDIGCNAGSVPSEPPRFMKTEEIEHLEDPELQQPKLSLSRVEETADISNLYPREILENEQPGDNLPQILSPEAPPGFEFMVVEHATANKAHNSSSVGLDSPKEDHIVHQSCERSAEDQAPRMDDLSDALKQSKESSKQQRRQQHQGGRHTSDDSMPSATVLSLNQNLQQSLDTERLGEKSVAEDLLKTKKQQKKHHGWQQPNRPTRTLTKAQRKGTVTPNRPIVVAIQCLQQEHPISDRGRRRVQLAMKSSSEPKKPSIPRKMTRTQLKRITSQPAASTDLFALKHLEQENSPETNQQVGKPCGLREMIGGAQQQEQHISDRDRRQVQFALESSSEPNQLSTRTQQPAPSTDLFALKHLEQEILPETKQQADKPCGLSKKTGALPNEMIIPDIHGNLDRREAQQLTELSKMEGSHEIVLAIVEPSSVKKQQLEEGRSTPGKLNMDDRPDILLLQSPTGFEAVSIEKSSQTDRARRQLKRWSKNPGEPKSVSTSKVEQLPFCASADQHLVHVEEPLSTSKVEPLPLCASADQHLVQMEEPLALATREEALDLTDPQHEVHLEQTEQQPLGRLLKYKEDGAKTDNSSILALATNEEVLCLDDPQDEVHLKQQKNKPRGRAPPKGKEDGADPGTTVLKNMGLSKKLTKKQNGRGLGRHRKAQQ